MNNQEFIERAQRRALRKQRALEKAQAGEVRLQRRAAKAAMVLKARAERAKRKADKEALRLQAKEARSARRAAKTWQAKEERRTARYLAKQERERKREAYRQECLIKKMNRECEREERRAHIQEVLSKYTPWVAKGILRSEAKARRQQRKNALAQESIDCAKRGDVARSLEIDKLLTKRKRNSDPVKRRATIERMHDNWHDNLLRKHARRLGLTLGQYKVYRGNPDVTLEDALKLSKDGFALPSSS